MLIGVGGGNSNKMKKNIFVFLLLCIISSLLVSCISEQNNVSQKDFISPNYLVLVNKKKPINEDFIKTIQLKTVPTVYDNEDTQVEVVALNAFENLKTYLESKGVIIGIDSSYRSVQEQQNIMDKFIKNYGEDYAKVTVAIPGTSEHHTGLAIDIVPFINGKWVTENEDMMKEPEIFKIIHESLAEYGFILRYPKGKEDITGYSYEPWHIRYVGVEYAKDIYKKQITLEEYLSK